MRENMNTLIDFFDRGAPEWRLTMHRGLEWVRQDGQPIPQLCGSAGCIAGAAVAFAVKDETALKIQEMGLLEAEDFCSEDWGILSEVAMQWLGLSPDGSLYGHRLFDPDLSPSGCTPEQAAEALRAVQRGETPWHDPLEEIA